MALKISVAIATWQRKKLLSQLILALEEQTVPRDDYEIIVCDSGSADGTNEMMVELCKRFTNIKYINLPINTLSAKRNEGIRRASAPIVIFMDDDLQPVKTFLEAHLRAHNAGENAVFCGQIRFPAKWIERSNYFRFRDSRQLGYTRPEINHSDIPFLMLVGMNLSFKKEEILRRVGWVCEEFTHYGGEDHEFAYRISRAGIRIEFAEEALVYHCEAGGSIGQYMKKMFVTARDSAPLLQSLVPGVWDMGALRYFEPSSPADRMSMKVNKWTLRLATSPLFSKPVQTLLEKTDHIRILYFPPAFRFLFAAAFAQGVRARKLKNSNYPVEERAWF